MLPRLTALPVAFLLLGPATAGAVDPPEPAYRIRIVDTRGRAVAGATVRVGTVGGAPLQTLRSDRRGFVIARVGTALAVHVHATTADGRVGGSPLLATEGCADLGCFVWGFDRTLRIQVAAPARTTGIVRGPRGPVAGARVGLRWMGSGQGTILHRVFQDDPGPRLRRLQLQEVEPEVLGREAGGVVESVTDATGRFTLEAHFAGVYAIVVDADGLESKLVAPVQLAAGYTTTTDVSLGPGFRLDVATQGVTDRGLVTIATADGCEKVSLLLSTGLGATFPGLPAGRYVVWADGVAIPALAVEGTDRPVQAVLSTRGPARAPAGVPFCAAPQTPMPEARDYPSGPLCDLGFDLYPVGGRMVVTPYWSNPTPRGLLEGDVVDAINGQPAPRTWTDRCGRSVTLSITRPATGEHLTVRHPLRPIVEEGP